MAKQRAQEVLFLFLTNPGLELNEFAIDPKAGPQAVYVHCPADKGTKMNLLETHLQSVEKIEGYPREEFIEK